MVFKNQNNPNNWRFNNFQWQNKIFKQEAEKDIKYYFTNNLNKNTSLRMVWDASKACFRGFAIKYMTKK